MKKIFFILLITFLTISSRAQTVLVQVAKNYFRSNPFEHEFGIFLRHLMNDPTMTDLSISHRNDSALFYLRGSYTTHKPFFFHAKRTEVVLAETAVIVNDSLRLLDTIIRYQLVGHGETGKDGEADVKKEFDRFNRKYSSQFIKSEYIELKSGTKIYGAIRNYFVPFSYLSPLSIAWQNLGDGSEHIFVITLQFKIKENIAVLPETSDSP